VIALKDFLIYAVITFVGLCLYRLWKKRKITNDAEILMKQVILAWAAQGPFQTGAESARAMRYGFLAVIGVDAAKTYEETINLHEEAFNANPSHWNSLVPKHNSSFHKNKEKILERLSAILSSSEMSNNLLSEIRDSENFDHNLSSLAGYLIEVKDKKLIEIFDERRISFHGLKWSENSGAHEEHLKRRINNPLFPKERRLVTQADVDAAISIDTIEAIELNEKKMELLSKIASIADEISLNDINQLREETEELITQCDRIGEKANLIKKDLIELRQKLMDSWINAYPHDSPERQKLVDLELLTKQHVLETYDQNRLTPHIARGDVIPSDEIILSMMSGDPDLFRYWYQQFDEEFKNNIKLEAMKTLRDAISEGLPEEKAQQIVNVFN
jgi:uncharacterized protein YeaO (DUF488 family)